MKSYLPRSLYGRAALILLVPLVALQLVVSVVFIQRHYTGVTEQMSRNVALELRYLLQIVNSESEESVAKSMAETVAEPLAFTLVFSDEMPTENAIALIDLSGTAMIETMSNELPTARRFDLSERRTIKIWLETDHGVVSASFNRKRVSASNPHQLLVLMVFTGILLTIIAFVFLRNQLRPIKRLARVSEAFGKGRTEAYVPTGATEVRAAGTAFIDMRERIERQIEQRTLMLSGVSHDLRTPLTRLKLGLSMGEGDAETDALLRDVEDMERLLDEFLAFARGDTLDDLEWMDPADITLAVVDRFDTAAVSVGDIAEGEQIMLRPIAVSRVLENLIGNALRYGRNCRVSLVKNTSEVRFIVEDDGPGIPLQDRENAKKPFVRLDPARNQDKGSGVGLGLAIAHDIARKHGGDLELGESSELGGLKAELILPL